jgi:hypothetical protein
MSKNGEGNGHWGRTQLDGTRVDSINAEQVEVSRSAVRSLNARNASLSQTANQRMHAESVVTRQSAVASLKAGTVTLRESAAGVVLAQNAALDEARVVFLAAPVVRGNVRALIDLRAGFMLGLGIVAGRLVLKAVGRLTSRQ